ncbi:MAG: zinc ABC transporter substrate-binding protein [Chloroflexi bacterium]|nr:zinc ABC transporter substrate-binding protein [Chloroflexota bacterium]
MRVGGDRVEVTNLVAAGGEPHDLELTPRDLERLRQSRLLVYIGSGFQPAVEKAIQAIDTSSLVTLDVTQDMSLMEGVPEEDEHESPGGRADGPKRDTHVWLDPANMQAIATKVQDALSEIDPAGRPIYEMNAKTYVSTLAALDQEFRNGLKSCKRKEIVTSHAAFAYLANRYGLQQVPITGLDPEAEPSPRRLQEVVQVARERNAKVIFFETLIDPKVADTIAREIGAKTMVLNPIEGLTPEEQKAGKGYVDLMRQNLANLKTALEC